MRDNHVKKNISLIINIIIIMLEVYSFIECLKISGLECFEYYTQDSNLFLMISSLIYVFYSLKNKDGKVPHYVSVLKYSSTTAVSVTFLVVLTFLAPVMGGYKMMLLDGTMKFHHLICPLLAFISFIFLENHQLEGIKDALFAMIFTLIYGAVTITLNILGVMYGPYPFLKVYEQSVLASIMWMSLMIGSNYLLNLGIGYLNDKFND